MTEKWLNWTHASGRQQRLQADTLSADSVANALLMWSDPQPGVEKLLYALCDLWPYIKSFFWSESHGTADNRRQADRLLRFIKKRAGGDNMGSGGFCGHEWVVQFPKDTQSTVLWSVCLCFPELNSGTSRWPAVSYQSGVNPS